MFFRKRQEGIVHGERAMRVVGRVRLLRGRELRLPVARAHLALIERLLCVPLDDLGEGDDRAFEGAREVRVGLTRERAEFDQVGGEEAEVAEELLTVVCAACEGRSVVCASSRGEGDSLRMFAPILGMSLFSMSS